MLPNTSRIILLPTGVLFVPRHAAVFFTRHARWQTEEAINYPPFNQHQRSAAVTVLWLASHKFPVLSCRPRQAHTHSDEDGLSETPGFSGLIEVLMRLADFSAKHSWREQIFDTDLTKKICDVYVCRHLCLASRIRQRVIKGCMDYGSSFTSSLLEALQVLNLAVFNCLSWRQR